MNPIRQTLLILCLILGYGSAFAQGHTLVRVQVTPNSESWNYSCGEKSEFTVTVTRSGIPYKDLEVTYEYGPEMLPPTKKATEKLKNGKLTIDAGTMKQPGFLRFKASVTVDGVKYDGLCTAAYEAEKIQPTVENPKDFDTFWSNAKKQLDKVPMEYTLRELPERNTDKVNVYEVSLRNIGNSRFYGILCVPKAPGKYPAYLRVPGAGSRPYQGEIALAEQGAITLQVGIHGIPVTMTPSVYDELRYCALSNYNQSNIHDKNSYYYRRVYLGCVRAAEFLTTLEEWDGNNLCVSGGSQGGALAITTAALLPKVSYVISLYPALSDMTGYLHNRAGGWPHLFRNVDPKSAATQVKLETVPYYDVVNFARRITQPIAFSWGYNDVTCPPTSYYAAYNVIPTPKELILVEETGHWTYKEQWDQLHKLFFDNLIK